MGPVEVQDITFDTEVTEDGSLAFNDGLLPQTGRGTGAGTGRPRGLAGRWGPNSHSPAVFSIASNSPRSASVRSMLDAAPRLPPGSGVGANTGAAGDRNPRSQAVGLPSPKPQVAGSSPATPVATETPRKPRSQAGSRALCFADAVGRSTHVPTKEAHPGPPGQVVGAARGATRRPEAGRLLEPSCSPALSGPLGRGPAPPPSRAAGRPEQAGAFVLDLQNRTAVDPHAVGSLRRAHAVAIRTRWCADPMVRRSGVGESPDSTH